MKLSPMCNYSGEKNMQTCTTLCATVAAMTASRRNAPGQLPAAAAAAAHGGGGRTPRRLHVAQHIHRVAEVAVQLRHGIALVLQLQLPAPQPGDDALASTVFGRWQDHHVLG